MGRGGDLTSNERTTIVGMNITRFKNYGKKQINRGNIKVIMKLRSTSGGTCGKTFVQDISQEMKCHEEFNIQRH